MILIDKNGGVSASVNFPDLQSVQYLQSALITAMQHLLSGGNPDQVYQDMAYTISMLLEAISFNAGQMENISEMICEKLAGNDKRALHFFNPPAETR